MRKIRITKTERKVYFWIFIIAFVSLMGALVIDNIFWVSASPEWKTAHTVTSTLGSWTGGVIDYTFGEKLDYIFGYRVYSVLTNYRDISASLVFAIIILGSIMFVREILGKMLLKSDWFK